MERWPIEMIAVRWGSPKEDGFFAEKRGAGVFHASIGETGNQDLVVFREWERLREKLREIVDALRGDLLDFGSFVFGFFEFGLADIEAWEASGFVNFTEGAGSEGEEIGANGASLGKNC